MSTRSRRRCVERPALRPNNSVSRSSTGAPSWSGRSSPRDGRGETEGARCGAPPAIGRGTRRSASVLLPARGWARPFAGRATDAGAEPTTESPRRRLPWKPLPDASLAVEERDDRRAHVCLRRVANTSVASIVNATASAVESCRVWRARLPFKQGWKIGSSSIRQSATGNP